jgi:hypothetical protein
MDETLALMAMIPFIGMFFRKMHAWWHAKFSHKCHEKTCDDTHVAHVEQSVVLEVKPFKRKVYSGTARNLTKEDCERLVEESRLLRHAVEERLNRLDHITPEDLKIRCK